MLTQLRCRTTGALQEESYLEQLARPEGLEPPID